MIEEAIIKGFRGTFLANISNLHFTFGSPIQIIAGTNGCGKTRLMNELHPLPPDPKDYTPGGSKVLLIKVPTGRFRLSSLLKKKAFEHSFVQIEPDGSELELNQGGTATVQRELVQRYFGITPLIQSVLSGKLNANRFSGMPYMRRRELFTELCPVDLSYALGVYQKLKTQASHALGARKTAEKRLANITAQLIDQNEILALQRDSDQLKAELEVLMRNFRQELQQHPRQVEREIEQIESDLNRICAQVLRRNDVFSTADTPKQISSVISELQAELNKTNAEIDSNQQHFMQLNEMLLELSERDGMSKESVTSRLNELERLLRAFGEEVRQSDIQESGLAIEQLEIAKGYLVDCLQSMPNPSLNQLDFSKEAAEQRRVALRTLREEIGRRKNKIDFIQQDLQQTQYVPQVECPRCQNKFKPGVHEHHLEEMKQVVVKLEEELFELNKSLELAESDEQLQLSYEDGLQRLRKAVVEFPRLQALWRIFATIPFARQNTQRMISEISQFERYLGELSKYRDLQREEKKLKEVLEHFKNVGAVPADLISAQAKSLELTIEKLTAQSRVTSSTIEMMSKKLERVEGFISEGEAVRGMVAKRSELYQLRIELERNNLIEQLIETHQRQLALITHRLHEVTVNQALVQDLNQQIAELKQAELHYDQLLEALSPTDGLIAEQLSGFIAEFVGKMNEIISKFWTYDIKVYPCGIENGELNYKFPVEIISEENRPSDVSEASWGQKDLIDFAFKLVLALYLRRPEWPIYLDELGATFDETHHRKILQFVKDYVTSGKASMVFIVSHYASSHTAMSDAELTILDASNVTVLKEYNKHVVLS